MVFATATVRIRTDGRQRTGFQCRPAFDQSGQTDQSSLLDEASALVSGDRETQVSEPAFTIRINDAVAATPATAALEATATVAPGVNLRFVSKGTESVAALRDDSIDLDIGAGPPAALDIRFALLDREHLVGIVRAGSPAGQRTMASTGCNRQVVAQLDAGVTYFVSAGTSSGQGEVCQIGPAEAWSSTPNSPPPVTVTGTVTCDQSATAEINFFIAQRFVAQGNGFTFPLRDPTPTTWTVPAFSFTGVLLGSGPAPVDLSAFARNATTTLPNQDHRLHR
ncbi:hypothetical protein ACWEOO_06640 [Kribbella sp. NPDC004138]